MELYKYCKKEHVPRTETNGSVRIGTLYDFRDEEKFGTLVSDMHEGTKRTDGTAEKLHYENIHLFPSLIGLLKLGPNAKIGTLNVSNLISKCENMFIFSASLEYSLSEHEHWYREEGYDACYRIHSARLFFSELSSVLAARGYLVEFGAVSYTDSIDISSPNIHPALVKRCAYEHQKEFRAIWQPNDVVEIQPIQLSQTNVGRYCSLYKLISKK